MYYIQETKVREGGDQIPLIVLPDGRGHTQAVRKALIDDKGFSKIGRPIWFVADPRRSFYDVDLKQDYEASEFSSFERYVDRLKDVIDVARSDKGMSENPCLLLGYSAAGQLALDIRDKLMGSGKGVIHPILVDAVDYHRVATSSVSAFATQLMSVLSEITQAYESSLIEQSLLLEGLSQKTPLEQLAHLQALFDSNYLFTSSGKERNDEVFIFLQNYAWYCSTKDSCQLKLADFFYSEDSAKTYGSTEEELLGFKLKFLSSIRRTEIKGTDHFSILQSWEFLAGVSALGTDQELHEWMSTASLFLKNECMASDAVSILAAVAGAGFSQPAPTVSSVAEAPIPRANHQMSVPKE